MSFIPVMSIFIYKLTRAICVMPLLLINRLWLIIYVATCSCKLTVHSHSKYKEGNNRPSSVLYQISLVHNHDKSGNKHFDTAVNTQIS